MLETIYVVRHGVSIGSFHIALLYSPLDRLRSSLHITRETIVVYLLEKKKRTLQ